jgi:SAM-dependent methyltransferase
MKLKHLETKYAEIFKQKNVAEAYIYRPTYPIETFEILSGLIAKKPGRVLDVGCGTGNIARYLIKYVDFIDAVDFSENMISVGKLLPEGDNPNINWICSSVEKAPLSYQYDLITAGASLHWMDWDIVLPRFKDLLLPDGYLAIIDDSYLPTPWEEELKGILKTYSTNQDYKPYNLINELEGRNLYIKTGEKITEPEVFKQPLNEYIESFHARNGFSREDMGEVIADRFDDEVRNLLLKYCSDGNVELQVIGKVVWGKPLDGGSNIE